MKKLLFVTALLAMGTMAMGAKDLTTGENTEAQVEVRAEIVNESLTITDIYGKPLLLNFGRIQKNTEDTGAKVWTAEVEYKITANDLMSNEEKIDVKLGGTTTGTEVAEVILKHSNNNKTGKNATITAKLTLDEATKTIAQGKDEVRGRIDGSIDESLKEKELGTYSVFTTLTATVQ